MVGPADPDDHPGAELHDVLRHQAVEEEGAVEPALPGITAAKFRESLRTTFLVTGLPVFMFGVVLHLWGPWLMIFFAGLLAMMIGIDVIRRCQRLKALRERGELS